MKVVSGGQTGVDRAALDAAMAVGLDCGGWCPRGRLAEDGPIDARYPLEETPSQVYAERTEWNVRDSDATLVLTFGEPHGGTAFTVELLQRYGRPYLVVDLMAEQGVDRAYDWLRGEKPATLNVAGPREDSALDVYRRAHAFLAELFGRVARERAVDSG